VNKNFIQLFNNSIFGYKLRTYYEQLRLKILKKLLRLKILKKLKTASLNSEFTGSYKKKV